MKKSTNLDLEKADKEIITFLELLLEKKDMSGLPSEILSSMLVDLYSRFEKFLILTIMQEVSEDEYKKMNEFLETNPTPEESKIFLEENIKNIREIVVKALNEFEKIYLNNKK